MQAQVGDHIVLHDRHVGGPVREGEVVEVEQPDGSPPYRVRWAGDGEVTLFFPGPDAVITHAGESHKS
jgi:hypothetical protein